MSWRSVDDDLNLVRYRQVFILAGDSISKTELTARAYSGHFPPARVHRGFDKSAMEHIRFGQLEKNSGEDLEIPQ